MNNKVLEAYTTAENEGFSTIQINEEEALVITKIKIHNGDKSFEDKVKSIPQDAKDKLQETLTKIVNEGSGGMMVILL